MREELKLVKIDSNYCDFLRKFDNRVPYNYKEKENRPFIGVLFEINSCKYFAPLSSPKSKHLKMKSKLDFFKLDHGRLGAINFNNMLPVLDNNVIALNLNKHCLTNKEEKYQKLLKEQFYWLKRHNDSLYSKSKKIYEAYVNQKMCKQMYDRCCDFKLLEEKCLEYNTLK